MQPISIIPRATLQSINVLFSDVDDTITTDGLLTARVLETFEQLRAAGIKLVPVTGRPAGWCHGLPRLWPIAGVIAENGSVAYWLHEGVQRELHRYNDATVRTENMRTLLSIQRDMLARFPQFLPAQDQFLRTADIAFDHAENNPNNVTAADNAALLAALQAEELTTAISSIHIHGTVGEANKFTMTRAFVRAAWGLDLDAISDRCAFIGDSANDAPMFDYFAHSVGVANVVHALPNLNKPPRYITNAAYGEGFIEFAQALIAARS